MILNQLLLFTQDIIVDGNDINIQMPIEIHNVFTASHEEIKNDYSLILSQIEEFKIHQQILLFGTEKEKFVPITKIHLLPKISKSAILYTNIQENLIVPLQKSVRFYNEIFSQIKNLQYSGLKFYAKQIVDQAQEKKEKLKRRAVRLVHVDTMKNKKRNIAVLEAEQSLEPTLENIDKETIYSITYLSQKHEKSQEIFLRLTKNCVLASRSIVEVYHHQIIQIIRLLKNRSDCSSAAQKSYTEIENRLIEKFGYIEGSLNEGTFQAINEYIFLLEENQGLWKSIASVIVTKIKQGTFSQRQKKGN